MKGSEKINKVLKYLNLTPSEFSNKLELKYVQNVYDIQKDKVDISKQMANKIILVYPVFEKNWLLTGEGSMLKNSSNIQFYEAENVPAGKKLIPFYDDVSTVGGKLPEGYTANSGNSAPSEWIDPGDWFKNATAALRHYGESMTEYPSGCILALKEVQDRRLIVPGKDYVIETSEYRVTKKIQLCNDSDYIRAYSTNEEMYADGTLIHQPFNIPLSLIGRIFEVLGYVVKKGGGTIVFSNQNK